MKIVQNLNDLPQEKGEIALTIGTFDGVHKGHQQILHILKNRGTPYLITFNSHPLQVVSSKSPSAITTLEHKLALLEKEGVDRCYLLHFTDSFAQQSAKEFLTILKKTTNFSTLILGHDAKIGYKRQGDKECITALARELHFHIEYIPPYSIAGTLISSSLIRSKIEANALSEAALFLGRKYSIVARVVEGAKRGRALGYPTANIPVEGLALPISGVWSCSLVHRGKHYSAIANLGVSPTFSSRCTPLLEVHLLEKNPPTLYGELVEITFEKHVRPEKCFSNSEELKEQIALDIKTAFHH